MPMGNPGIQAPPDPTAGRDKRVARTVLKNTGAQIAGHLLITAGKYSAYVIIFRYLGSARFGEYSLLLSLLAYGEIILDFGLTDLFVRDLSRTPEQKRELLAVMTEIKFVQAAVAYGLLVLLLVALRYDSRILAAGMLAGAEFLFMGGVLVYKGLFRAALAMERAAVAEVISTVSMVVLFLASLKMGLGIVGLMAALVLSRLIFLAGCMYWGRDLVEPFALRWNKGIMWEYFINALPVGLAMVMVGIYQSVDLLMLSKMASWKDVGLYAAAYRFVLPLVMVPAALMAALYPLLCSYWERDMEKFCRMFDQGIQSVVVIGGAIFCVLTVAAEFFMGIFGPEAVEASGALRMLAYAIAAMSISVVIGPMFIVIQRQWLAFLVGLCGAVVNATLNVFLIPRYGYMGAAFATFMTEVCVLVPAVHIIQRATGHRARWWILLQVAAPAAVAAVAVGRTGLQGGFLGGIAALVLYVAGCLLSGAIRIDEVSLLVKNIRATA